MSGTVGSKATGASPVGGPVLGGDAGRILESKGRATPKGASFGQVLASARPILKGAEAVASVLPGGPLVAAAVKAPAALAKGATPTTLAMSTGPSPLSGGGVGTSAGVGPMVGSTGAVDGGPAEKAGIEGVLADSQAFNLYYLQLQEQISAESRGYSALSNVLKARHDTVKNAIGNVR